MYDTRYIHHQERHFRKKNFKKVLRIKKKLLPLHSTSEGRGLRERVRIKDTRLRIEELSITINFIRDRV